MIDYPDHIQTKNPCGEFYLGPVGKSILDPDKLLSGYITSVYRSGDDLDLSPPSAMEALTAELRSIAARYREERAKLTRLIPKRTFVINSISYIQPGAFVGQTINPQPVTVTGRIGSSQPNQQSLPLPDRQGVLVRNTQGGFSMGATVQFDIEGRPYRYSAKTITVDPPPTTVVKKFTARSMMNRIYRSMGVTVIDRKAHLNDRTFERLFRKP